MGPEWLKKNMKTIADTKEPSNGSVRTNDRRTSHIPRHRRSQHLRPLVASGGQAARRGRHRPRLQLAQRLLRWVAEQFVARGLAVYALDLRGRGKSDGERFYVEKFADYVERRRRRS